MSEPNWTVRIIVFLVVVIVIGGGIVGYYESTKPPTPQHITQAVPNDRLP
jgi:hypothetical protein